jgi:acyl-CoA thioesterase FadM
MWFPEFPDVLSWQRAKGSVYMRYEDVTQDGALKIVGMPHAVGLVCLGKLWFRTRASLETRPQGVIPILSRIAMETTGGPMSVRHPVEVEGAFQLAHTRDEARAVNRLMLNAYAELFAPRGHTYAPPSGETAARVHVGRAYAEHVFTRPSAPPGARKVLALPLADGPQVPGPELSFREPLSTLALPQHASWIDGALMLTPSPITFGLAHTDANRHVNTLVYPQIFEDAGLNRLMDLGQDTRALLVDHIDIAFRKPCFAGERMYLWVRAFVLRDKVGVVSYLGLKDSAPEHAHCTCALTFRRGELTLG